MAERKKRTYRKKKAESDDESQLTPDSSLRSESETSTPRNEEDVSSTIEELEELRKLRRKHAGIDSAKLLKGEEKKKKKAQPANPDPWKLKTGGLVDKDEIHADGQDAEKPEQKLKLDSFTTQTNTLDVDKHMMAYIEEEMKKRRGEGDVVDQTSSEAKESRGYHDIYDELYKIPDHLRVDKKPVVEGNVQLSTQMLTAIPEVDLGMDVRLQNIAATEHAKRALSENQQGGNKQSKNTEYNAPSRFSMPKQTTHDNNRSRSDKRHTATDDAVMERFKKRMRN
ncbi:hepatocellular carcinoma-associated antigen 59-domain-containing protein [Umbelopsis sp. AD052]|nr:hepatocellular carcinoma-associated antigen 59-domain-containing protein [Umbelopsis sp. AD052]